MMDISIQIAVFANWSVDLDNFEKEVEVVELLFFGETGTFLRNLKS